ncbi:MAG: ribosomal RNA small subunit methyltransferase A [Candidatus Anammoximicrobium sp.]|nr:ribosomal RNA small subunit methyltransferase A [Candidatus Anammoximicrobium sp.]
MTSPRQTASFLIGKFREVGIRPDTRRGQNFLIDLNLVQLLADSAELGPDDVVLEVGTGTGSLTALLAARAAAVVTVEVDPQLSQLASETLIDCTNVTMLRQDVLRNKSHFSPDVLAAVREKLAEQPGRRFKLAANLPYNIATPVLSNLLSTDLQPVSMTVTIQKEVADRITAAPSTRDYGALSIWMQSQCEVRTIRVLPPTVFWPQPKVESAILQILPHAEKRARISDLAFFHTFIRSIFFHRRKFLRSGLLSAFKSQLDKPAVDAILREQNLETNARAEELGVEAMLALCEAIRRRVAPG